MQCSDVRQRLLVCGDGSDSRRNGNPDDAAALKHAGECASCAKFLEEVREVSRMVGLLHVDAPQDFMSGLHEKLTAGVRPSVSIFSVWKPALAASFLLAVLAASGMFMFKNRAGQTYVSNQWNSAFLNQTHVYAAPVLPEVFVPDAETPASHTAKTASRVAKTARRHIFPRPGSSMASMKTTPSAPSRGILHEQVIKIQLTSENSAGNNVALILESGDGASFEGENSDGKIVLWQGAVPGDKPVALLFPVKVEGKKAAKVKATVVTSSDEMLTDSVSIGKNVRSAVISKPPEYSGDEKIPGKCIVFLPSSLSSQTQKFSQSGVSVSMQTGALALSDITVDRMKDVPNPKGELDLVLADTKVDLTHVQVLPQE